MGQKKRIYGKRLFSILLCGVLVISQLGTSVFALERESGDNGSSVVQETGSPSANGSKPSDENNGQGSVDLQVETHHPDVDENIQPNAGADTTDPAVDTTDPAVEPTGPAVEPTGPAVDATDSAVEPTGPAVEPTDPAVEPTGPAVELTGPAMELTGPAMELTGPAMELTGPAIGITGPAVELTIPALLLLQLPMPIDTPVRISDYPVEEDYNPQRNYIIQDESDLRKLAELVNGTAKKIKWGNDNSKFFRSHHHSGTPGRRHSD